MFDAGYTLAVEAPRHSLDKLIRFFFSPMLNIRCKIGLRGVRFVVSCQRNQIVIFGSKFITITWAQFKRAAQQHHGHQEWCDRAESGSARQQRLSSGLSCTERDSNEHTICFLHVSLDCS